jgi:hypothetical protein
MVVVAANMVAVHSVTEVISEKFKHIRDGYNIKTILKTENNLWSFILRTRPEKYSQKTTHCVYSTPCECWRGYVTGTGRPLAVRLREHKHNLKMVLLEKSKLAKNAYEEGHRVDWDEVRIWEIESDSKYSEHKDISP